VTHGLQSATSPDYPANEGPALDRSRLASAQRAVVELTEILEDSVDLLGATLREEAARVPVVLLRAAAVIFASSVGALFLTAAAALYLRDVFGGWAFESSGAGGVYVLSGVVLWKSGRARQ